MMKTQINPVRGIYLIQNWVLLTIRLTSLNKNEGIDFKQLFFNNKNSAQLEKFLQHRPYLLRQNLSSVMLVAQGVGEITAIFEIEMDMLVAIKPLLKGHHHVEQYFVAVADQKRLLTHESLPVR